MIAPPRDNLDSWLINFIGNAVPDTRSKHNGGALNEVVHDIFEFWHEGLLVYQVEEYSALCSYLDPDVASDEVNLPTHVIDFVILHPFAIDLLKEQDGIG